MNNVKNFVRGCLLVHLFALVVAGQAQQFAEIGNFQLENGEVIRDCRIGYRTFGKLNADKSNVIVFPTWASGTTEQLAPNFGPGKLINSEKYYVVAIDALGNGVSSSPSNSKLQPRMKFPRFTLRDVVRSQHQLLTQVLKINHVKALVGISMGGMQTFQWIVEYPDFMDMAIPIVGSPRLAPYDLLLWEAQIRAIMNDREWNNGNYISNPSKAVQYAFGQLLLTTPDNFNKNMTRQKLFDQLEKAEKEGGFDANDKIRQAQAMMALDITRGFGGSMEQTAAALKARVFNIVAKLDHVVTPGPAMEFARLLGAESLVLEGDCGHLAPSCESEAVNAAVTRFLEGWNLVWNDEFKGPNNSPVDLTRWTPEIGGHGWGNNELQYYTNRIDNAYQHDGSLVIKAISEKYKGTDTVTRDFTSARLITKNKFSQAYGRFEARIKVPYGQGIWPAFWLLGTDIDSVGWPNCGEIDVMENIGKEPSTIHGTLHGPGYSGAQGINASYTLPDNRRFADSFHTFAVEWEPNVIRFYCDDHLYKTRTPADLPQGARWVFDRPFFILLNVAVGGNWPGSPDDTTIFPQTMLVDYVRVYHRA